MALYKATFGTCLYRKYGDGTFKHLGNREDGERFFTELSLPWDHDLLPFHPKPGRPRNADDYMYTASLKEYNPRMKRWEPFFSQTF